MFVEVSLACGGIQPSLAVTRPQLLPVSEVGLGSRGEEGKKVKKE